MGLGLYSRGLKIKIQKLLESAGIMLEMRVVHYRQPCTGRQGREAADFKPLEFGENALRMALKICFTKAGCWDYLFFNILSTFLEILLLVLTIVLKSKFYNLKKKKTQNMIHQGKKHHQGGKKTCSNLRESKC